MVRYVKGHKQESLLRIVRAAGRGFRRQGVGGIGVDGLAREAGVTHGAFYGHFASKAEALKAAVVSGLQELTAGILVAQKEHGSRWIGEFVGFYMGWKRTCDMSDACTVPVLSPEIERADEDTRTAYQTELKKVVDALAAGFSGGSQDERDARAWVFLSLLAGGVILARAVPSAELSETIARAVSNAALTTAALEKPVMPG